MSLCKCSFDIQKLTTLLVLSILNMLGRFLGKIFLDDPPFILQILIKLRVALTIVSSIELVGYVFR